MTGVESHSRSSAEITDFLQSNDGRALLAGIIQDLLFEGILQLSLGDQRLDVVRLSPLSEGLSQWEL